MPKPHPIIDKLIALDMLKTWSLIVTLFGDLDGEDLSGTQIRDLLGHIGIKPEAIRVALHRLKSDGWITSSKRGREAVYRLTSMARSETEAVAPDIYGASVKKKGNWQLHLVKDISDAPEAISLNRNLVIVPKHGTPLNADSLPLEFGSPELPKWVETSLVSESLLSLAGNLERLVGHFSELESQRDQFVFRLLILHHWRRIALRSGAWAHASLVPNGDIAKCHTKVVALLASSSKIKDVSKADL